MDDAGLLRIDAVGRFGHRLCDVQNEAAVGLRFVRAFAFNAVEAARSAATASCSSSCGRVVTPNPFGRSRARFCTEAMAQRDTELWRLDILLDAAFNLLAVLAALNRLYFTRFELKRTRALIAQMPLAPPRLADRLESLRRLEPDAAADQLGQLIAETRALVTAELPDLELPLPFPPGTRQQPWSR